MSTPALNINSLTAGYRHTPIVRDLTLTVAQGEMLAILGPNGAGKTTLLRAITGLCAPMKGSIDLFGKRLSRISSTAIAQQIAVVPQHLDLPVAFTVEELVHIGRTARMNRWGPPSADDRKIVERAMAYTDTVDMRHAPYTQLSGGEKQRAIIAMALAQEPRLILMDEATSHLDLNHRLEVMQIVERLNTENDVTVVMVSHDLNLAAEFCRRLVFIDKGKLVADGPPAQVLTEQLLRTIYHCEVLVQQNAASGSVSVVPAPRLAHRHPGSEARIHVIAGGGSGEELLRRLVLCGFKVTCGPLNRGDSDGDIASALDIDTTWEIPFAPISKRASEAAGAMSESAQALVISGVAFGPGNLAVLDLAAKALERGKPVFIASGAEKRDYTLDKAASRKIEALLTNGACEWDSVATLVSSLPASDETPSDPLQIADNTTPSPL